jgi:hypothetical protein
MYCNVMFGGKIIIRVNLCLLKMDNSITLAFLYVYFKSKFTPDPRFLHYVYHNPAISNANVVRTSTIYHPINPATRPVTFSRIVWKYVAVLRREYHHSARSTKFILVVVVERKLGMEKCGSNSHHRNNDACVSMNTCPL